MHTPVATKPDIGRIVVLNHPDYLKEAQACADELRSADLGSAVLRLQSAGSSTETEQIITENLEPGDAIALVGGRGTRRTVVKALLSLQAQPEHQQLAASVAITSLCGGRSGLAGQADHHTKLTRRPSEVFRQGTRVEAWGMAIEGTHWINGEAKLFDTVALSYAGLGKTDQPAMGNILRMYRPRILFDLPDTVIPQSAGHILFAKSGYLGKYNRMPVAPWDQEILIKRTGTGRLGHLASGTGLLTNTSLGERSDVISLVPQSNVDLFRDGEPPLNLVTSYPLVVALTSHSYTILTTRRTANPMQPNA